MRTAAVSAAAAVLAAAASVASATTVTFNDFSSTAGLTLNGSAAKVNTAADGDVLRLTPALPNQGGSAFSSVTINAADFSTYFRFRITDPGGILFDGNTETGADGIVFVVQSVSSSLGGIGAGIGYAGIPNSVGVEFDTWHNGANNDPDSNHLGIDVNGNVNHGSPAQFVLPVATRFDDGNVWHAWVDYDGTTLEVRANQTGLRPAAADLTRTLDLTSILGQTTAFVGFTSGTGADWGNHDVLSWEYRDSFNPVGVVPTPAAAWAGLALLGSIVARKRFIAARG